MPLLLIFGLVDASHQTQIVSLYSHLSWWAVARAAMASLVATLPQIQRFLFVFEFALVAAHLFVAMAALREAQLVEAASAGFALSVCLALF